MRLEHPDLLMKKSQVQMESGDRLSCRLTGVAYYWS